VGSKSQKEVVPKIAAWLKPRSLPEETREKETERSTEERILQVGEKLPARQAEMAFEQRTGEKPKPKRKSRRTKGA
jgi:hypothetical protein